MWKTPVEDVIMSSLNLSVFGEGVFLLEGFIVKVCNAQTGKFYLKNLLGGLIWTLQNSSTSLTKAIHHLLLFCLNFSYLPWGVPVGNCFGEVVA